MQVPFVPMLLDRAPEPFISSGWVYQVKWDGVRNLTLVEGGQVRHFSRRLRERTANFPEFRGIASLLGPSRVVLDGEIVVMRGGRPSFSGILERDLAGKAPDLRRAAAIPATLMIFDLLEYGGRELYARPLAERMELLRSLVPAEEAWQVVSDFPVASGPDLFQAVVAQGLEGVVAKRSASPYIPGSRTRDWLKIKRRQRMLAVICGYTAPPGRPGGVLLGAYRQGRLVYVGRVGSGISGEQMTLLKANLLPSVRPFDEEPSLRDRFSGPPGPVVWTQPRLTALVEFSEWTEEQRLRDPVFVGFSTEPPSAAEIY